MKLKSISIPIAVALILSCCDSDNPTPSLFSAFFPLRIGIYQIYDIAETRYRPEEEDISYQEKHLVTGTFPGPAGTLNHIIQRYRRNTPDDTFDYIDTWSARIEPAQIILNKENIAYVLLAFPLVKGKQWNGNAYNTEGGADMCGSTHFPCDIYRVAGLATPYLFDGVLWTETVEIVQHNNTDPIVGHDVRKEIYAKGVGLIYKKSSIFEYCTIGSCIGKQQIQKGFTLEQSIYEYGHE